jgi:hypothetical protein
MTEIKIERKRSLWPWVILGLVLLAIIVYFIWFRSDKADENSDVNMALITVRENNTTVGDYIGFVNSDTATMTIDHNFTNQAILKLTNAVTAMADEIDFDIKADMDSVKVHGEIITRDPFETTHANHIRKAADILTNSLHRMQQAKYPELSAEAAQLKSSAASIDSDALTLDQREAVKGFFRQAADLLEKMN